MYIGGIGSNGIIKILKGLIENCINVCETKTDNIFFSIKIDANLRYEFIINSKVDIQPFLKKDNVHKSFGTNFYFQILEYITTYLKVENSNNKVSILFELNKEFIKDLNVDYQDLSEQILEFSLLNRNSEILLVDERNKYKNQNFYSNPKGIFYRYNRVLNNVLGNPEFEIQFDKKISGLEYQIILSYRTDWFPNPTIESYANNIKTICGGSLVDGIYKGLISGCEKYVNKHSLNKYKIQGNKFHNGLIIICSVKGKDFKYGGNFKESLEDDTVEKDSKKLIKKLTFDFLEKNYEIAEKFLWRFDESQLTSGMYE